MRVGGLKFRWMGVLATATPFLLVACGGGDDDSGEGGSTALTAPAGFTVGYGAKAYDFSWQPVVGATAYAVYEDPDGAGPQPEVEVARVDGAQSAALRYQIPSLLNRVNASYRVRACNASGCGDYAAALTPDLVKAIGYFKPDRTGTEGLADAWFGQTLALSADGQTMAIGAPAEVAWAAGSSGQSEQILAAGAVYVFRRGAEGWRPSVHLKSEHLLSYDSIGLRAGGQFGSSLSLSADGRRLAIGASVQPLSGTDSVGQVVTEANTTTGGAVHVYGRDGDDTWREQAYLRASKTVTGAGFGSNLALSADGATLAACAPRASIASEGVDRDGERRGVALVYALENGAWTEQAPISRPNDSPDLAYFCGALALSGDGQTLVTGTANSNTSRATVHVRQSGAWALQSHLPVDPGEGQLHGLSLSHDGATLALSIGGGADGRPMTFSGAKVYARNAETWHLQVNLPVTVAASEGIRSTVSLSADGNNLAVGIPTESGLSRGVDGDAAAQGLTRAGAAYVFRRTGDQWTQAHYVKASNPAAFAEFGGRVALSSDGATLAVTSVGERGESTGIQGDQTIRPEGRVTGAAYLY